MPEYGCFLTVFSRVSVHDTAQNMSEHEFSLTSICPCKDERKRTGEWKPVFWHILRSVMQKQVD